MKKAKKNIYKIGLAVSEFYPDFAEKLAGGARAYFKAQKTGDDFQLYTARAPGAVELALTADWLFEYKNCSAVLALGVVIRGQTSHYESVCRLAEGGMMKVQFKWSRPVIHGIIMAENKKQVQQRLSAKNHIGCSSAQACLAMLYSFKAVRNPQSLSGPQEKELL